MCWFTAELFIHGINTGRLCSAGHELRKMLKWPRPLPLEDERVRLMHEVLVLSNVIPNIFT